MSQDETARLRLFVCRLSTKVGDFWRAGWVRSDAMPRYPLFEGELGESVKRREGKLEPKISSILHFADSFDHPPTAIWNWQVRVHLSRSKVDSSFNCTRLSTPGTTGWVRRERTSIRSRGAFLAGAVSSQRGHGDFSTYTRGVFRA